MSSKPFKGKSSLAQTQILSACYHFYSGWVSIYDNYLSCFYLTNTVFTSSFNLPNKLTPESCLAPKVTLFHAYPQKSYKSQTHCSIKKKEEVEEENRNRGL